MVSITRGLSSDRCLDIMGNLRSLESDRNEAGMAIASYYKRLADQGGHDTKVVKMVRSLDKMAADKREVFLREFDAWRRHMNWDAQGNLFAQTGQVHTDRANLAEAAEGAGEPSEAELAAAKAPKVMEESEGTTDHDAAADAPALAAIAGDSPGAPAPMFTT